MPQQSTTLSNQILTNIKRMQLKNTLIKNLVEQTEQKTADAQMVGSNSRYSKYNWPSQSDS